ncbi:MAG: DnaA/Hda family protein [Elusimicrobiota bacterium]|nr:DnaA/Hda family protein [Elusimicrobiota bacterium]
MLKKWDVAPAPSDKNPGRHKLLIKGEMKDIFLIVKTLGSLCSRPEKTSGEFNFIIYISKLEMDTLKKLKSITSELSVSAQAAEEEEPFGEEPAPFFSPKPKLKTEPVPATEQPRPAPQPAPPVAQPRPAPQPIPPAERPRPAPKPVEQPALKLPVIAAQAQPPADSPAVSRPSGNFVPSITGRMKMEAATKAEAPAAAPASGPAPAPARAAGPPAGSTARTKAKWAMELPLIPTYSFQTLVAGSHNRFAHAAAMAVVENPGVIYNPLLLFGVPGTGKTHFINSISYGLSASIGQSNIFVTDGIKLSKGVELAIKEGGIGRLEELFAKVKVLIIDDVHLLMVSEGNKKYISKWLNDFVTQNKQIVATSVFPPKSLSGLEDAVGFQFTQGWMVDLKMPAPQAYKAILNQLMQGLDIKLSDEEVNGIFMGNLMPFSEVVKILENMKKLEKFMSSALGAVSHAQLLETLLGFGETTADAVLTEEDVHHASPWKPVRQDSAWNKWGIFFPKGMRWEAEFALYSMHERALELGLNPEWSQVFIEEYNSDELYGIPFKIGIYASEQNVNGVIIMGPQPTSALGGQASEFRQIAFKILDSFLVKSAWLPCEKLKSKAAYTKILMDLL